MAKDEKVSAGEVVRDIRRQTRRKYSAEEKIRMVPEGFKAKRVRLLSRALSLIGLPVGQGDG